VNTTFDLQIVKQLVALTRRNNITTAGLARILDVTTVTVGTWFSGTHCPYYSTTLIWAAHYDRHVAVVDADGKVLARGVEVLFQLRSLREQTGRTQRELAARLNINRPTVTTRETHVRDMRLSTVSAHVAALDYQLLLMGGVAS